MRKRSFLFLETIYLFTNSYHITLNGCTYIRIYSDQNLIKRYRFYRSRNTVDLPKIEMYFTYMQMKFHVHNLLLLPLQYLLTNSPYLKGTEMPGHQYNLIKA